MNYILHRDNITVSWGGIDYILSKDETVLLSQITRRVTPPKLWENYRDWHLEAGDQYLKRTAFYDVLRMLTRSDQKVLLSVDYMPALLVTGTIENLHNMFDDMIKDSDEKDVIEDYLTSLYIFLKYGYVRNVNKLNESW